MDQQNKIKILLNLLSKNIISPIKYESEVKLFLKMRVSHTMWSWLIKILLTQFDSYISQTDINGEIKLVYL